MEVIGLRAFGCWGRKVGPTRGATRFFCGTVQEAQVDVHATATLLSPRP